MPVPLLDLSAQHRSLWPEARSLFDGLVANGQFILGLPVAEFENELAQACGVKHAVGVASGTDALLAAMMALNIGAGDEVITSPFTFFATAGCVSRLGATPVFVDIDPETFNLMPEALPAAFTDRTKAIMPVHLFGRLAPMEPILEIADMHGAAVIEDAAQAINATDPVTGRQAGAMGRVGCLSFYPTKNLAAMGDAGACLTDDDDLAERIRCLRVHGQTGPYEHAVIGGNFRLDAMQAAVLGVKLPNLPTWTQARRRLADRYRTSLSDLPASDLTLPADAPDAAHVYNQFTLRIHEGRRDALMQQFSKMNVGCKIYYPLPLHLQPCFAHLGHKPGDFPHAELASQEVLSLPIFPEMTEVQQDEVIAVIRGFFQ